MLGLPTRLDSYVHVAGRTAREGRKGHAIALLTSAQQEERFVQYKRELGLKAEGAATATLDDDSESGVGVAPAEGDGGDGDDGGMDVEL